MCRLSRSSTWKNVERANDFIYRQTQHFVGRHRCIRLRQPFPFVDRFDSGTPKFMLRSRAVEVKP